MSYEQLDDTPQEGKLGNETNTLQLNRAGQIKFPLPGIVSGGIFAFPQTFFTIEGYEVTHHATQ